MAYIVASFISRFNTRSGQASTKGTTERIEKLGGVWWSDGSTLILSFVCKDRSHYENIKRTLNIYATCRVPMIIESADGSLTMRNGDSIPPHIIDKVKQSFK